MKLLCGIFLCFILMAQISHSPANPVKDKRFPILNLILNKYYQVFYKISSAAALYSSHVLEKCDEFLKAPEAIDADVLNHCSQCKANLSQFIASVNRMDKEKAECKAIMPVYEQLLSMQLHDFSIHKLGDEFQQLRDSYLSEAQTAYTKMVYSIVDELPQAMDSFSSSLTDEEHLKYWDLMKLYDKFRAEKFEGEKTETLTQIITEAFVDYEATNEGCQKLYNFYTKIFKN